MKEITRTIAFLLLLTATVWCSAQRKIRVACVGNSITYGYGIKDREHRSYPALLQRLLGDGFEVGNFGCSGRTGLSKGDRPYIKEKEYGEALAFLPDIVFIKLGTNDSKVRNWEHGDEFAADIESIARSFENLPSAPKVYLCFPAKAYSDKWTIRDSVIVGEIIPTLKKVAKANGWRTVDFHKLTSGMGEHFPDDIHPDSFVAEKMAAKVGGIVRKATKKIER